jgi:hypothetical protein
MKPMFHWSLQCLFETLFAVINIDVNYVQLSRKDVM